MVAFNSATDPDAARNAHDDNLVPATLVHDLRETLEILVTETTALKERLILLIAQRHAEKHGLEKAVPYYDAVGLDQLIASDPERYGWLKDFRRERSGSSS